MEFHQGALPMHEQLFSPLQEDSIAQWILDSEREGTPRTRKDVIEFAGLIAAQEDKPTIHVSDNWFERFKRDIRNSYSR